MLSVKLSNVVKVEGSLAGGRPGDCLGVTTTPGRLGDFFRRLDVLSNHRAAGP